MKRILVVGCGLMGTSLALALAKSPTEYSLDGMDERSEHIEVAAKYGVFQNLYRIDNPPIACYDLVALCVPVRAACDYLEQAFEWGQVVFDVCSVKTSICAHAYQSTAWERFVPTHPMAGKSVEGPLGATGTLFEQRPWLYLEGWPSSGEVLPLIQQTGALPVAIASPQAHDAAMATVSHSIHITSLAAMRAYGTTVTEMGERFDHLSGPAFQDITRLANSPTAFWTETLLENRISVLAQLDQVTKALTEFRFAIATNDETHLQQLLNEAKTAYEAWRGGRDKWQLR